MFKKTRLSNGLRLLTVPMPGVRSVTVLVMVAAGSRYEAKQINGISHFLEHMTFKGTKSRPSSLAISSLVDSIGASFNAFTSKEYTGFYIKAASEHLELILDVISDMLLNSLFDPQEIEKDKDVVIEEINMYEDQPQARVGELFEALLYKGFPLSRRVSGEKDVVRSLTRERIVDYFHKTYHSGSIVVGVAGGVEQSRVQKLVEKYFRPINVGVSNKFTRVKERQMESHSLVYFKKSDQAHLCLGTRAYPLGHPDRYVLALLATILGGNMSSRLFLEVREKRGLAYYIHSGVEEFHDCGYFVSQSGIRLSAVDEAIKVVLDQYQKMSSKKVSPEELKRAKDFWKGRMILTLEDSYRVAAFYTMQEVLDERIETPEEVLEKVDKVTLEDVQRVARDIFSNQKLNLAIIGPFKEESRFDKLLKL